MKRKKTNRMLGKKEKKWGFKRKTQEREEKMKKSKKEKKWMKKKRITKGKERKNTAET